MPNYHVTIAGKDYPVTASDPDEAWRLANEQVSTRASKHKALVEKFRAQDEAAGMFDPTSGMSGLDKVRANFGAGMADWWLGAKQLVGQGTGDEAREKKRMDDFLAQHTTGGRALQFAGNVAPAVIGAIPFGATAATVRGGAALGAGMGALAPTEDDNLVRGKLLNTSMGAVTGGAANKLLPMLVPAAQRAGSAVVQGVRRLTEGGRQRIASDAFKRQFDDPQAALALLRGHRDVPGAMPTTAQILNNPAMLATEHRLANTQGEAAQALLGRRMESNAARNQHLQGGLGANVPALEREADQFAKAAKPQLFDQPFNRAPVLGQLTMLQNENVSLTAKAALEEIKESVKRALASRNPVEQLHQIRMFQINDVMSRLSQSDRQLARSMRNDLNEVKKALDVQLDAATNGQWTPFLEGYGARAQARSEGQAGQELLETIGEKARADNAGNPMLTGQRGRLAAARNAEDDFGKPLYGAPGRQAIDDVARSLDVEGRVANVRPAGAATAGHRGMGAAASNDALLRPLTGQTDPGLLSRAARGVGGGGSGVAIGGMVGGLPGAGLGGVVGGIASDALATGAQGRALDIARRLFQMHMDPQAAIPILQEAVQARAMTPAQASAIMKILNQMGQRFLPGAQLSVPQHAGQTLADMLTQHANKG